MATQTVKVVRTEKKGVVAKANERGIFLIGETAWINLSKYAEAPGEWPNPGDSVLLMLDKDGYIREVTIEERYEAPELPTVGSAEAATVEPSRVLVRLACIKHAIAFLAIVPPPAGGHWTTSNVLETAGTFESWANPDDDDLPF